MCYHLLTDPLPSHLNLHMQTGAFLQLILTLSAIISRMDTLLLELRPVLGTYQETLHKAMGELDVRFIF